MKRKAFLLLELLVSSVIISITGLAISRTFSKEIELTGVSREMETLSLLCEQKLFDVELKLRELEKADELENFNLSGTFPGDGRYEWTCGVKALDQTPDFYELDLTVKGVQRDLRLVKLVRLDLPDRGNDEKKNEA